MSDNDIIKALECCSVHGLLKCEKCPKKNEGVTCMYALSKDALNLINRQQAEIERLNIRNKALAAITKNYDWKFVKAKSEAIKEFWKRFDKVLCENIGPSKRVYWKISSDGDNLVKEMTEVKADDKR